MNDDRTPDLLPVIQWLEAGCDPKHAAAELRIYAERLAALSAPPAQEPVAYIDGYEAGYEDAADQLRARDRQIVELCASVVESANNYDNPMTANDCAAAIRSLLEPAEKETSHGA